MGFWVYMLIVSELVPLVMIGFGRLFFKRPPKTINGVFGYRTTMSMKNQDTWDFAHRFCGRIWWRCGWVLLLLSAAAMAFMIGKETDAIALASGILLGVELAVLLGSIFPTEKALRKTFDRNGRRK